MTKYLNNKYLLLLLHHYINYKSLFAYLLMKTKPTITQKNLLPFFKDNLWQKINVLLLDTKILLLMKFVSHCKIISV